MSTTAPPDIDDPTHRRVFRFVDRHGSADPDTLRDVVDVDLERLHRAIRALERQGHLVVADGAVRIAVDLGAATSHAVGDAVYRIRPAGQDDLEALAKIVGRVAAEAGYVEAARVAGWLRYEKAVLRKGEPHVRVFFVATSDGDVVGWTHLEIALDDAVRHTAIQTVGVLEPYREQGLGGRLLERGLRWGRENGVEQVSSAVPATAEAGIRFLHAHGWETEAIRRDRYRLGGARVDEVILSVETGGRDVPVEQAAT